MLEEKSIRKLYKEWFLDYASYVILERAIPSIEDGFKPVQRRILHSMKLLDDGRYNKVANIIGQTMQFHPHGDASIEEAIINIGQKTLLIDTQGNWGDYLTGDNAAASRYIEARPSKFALEVLYDPKITEWQLSYDSRKQEPIALPVKFPLLLLQGAEGIAVGLSTKILPHNFIELCNASINYLKNKPFNLLPDFITGGIVDCNNYNYGLRGGKVSIRAKINVINKKTLSITEIPYGITTTNLIDSILKAHQKGKLKIKNIVDNTSDKVEIIINLGSSQDTNNIIDSLYVFTDCEINIYPNSCVIKHNKPEFIGVNEILKYSVENIKKRLLKGLQIKKDELLEDIFFLSLEKIFIENKIYQKIENCISWADVLDTIDKALAPYKKLFYRKIEENDIVKLTEIKIKRISKYNSDKAKDKLESLQKNLKEIEYHIKNIINYTIDHFKSILTKYGNSLKRKTQLSSFEKISASSVSINNTKLYLNKKDGFIGSSLKKDEFVCECSDIDDILIIKKDGKFIVTKIADKVFVGKNIIHVSVLEKNNPRLVYNLLYTNGTTGVTRAKRFQINSIIRDKGYNLTKGDKYSHVCYLSSNSNAEAETISITLSQSCKAKKKAIEFDFGKIAIKGKLSQGNIVTKYPIKKVKIKEVGKSTLKDIDIYYDPSFGKINIDKKGVYIGKFKGEDKILIVYKDGSYEINMLKINARYDDNNIFKIIKFNKKNPITVIYFDGNTKFCYIKKFYIETISLDKKFNFLTDNNKTSLMGVTDENESKFHIEYITENNEKSNYIYNSKDLEPRGWKALGTKLEGQKNSKVTLGATNHHV